MAAKPEFRTRVAETKEDIDRCLQVRIQVFIDEQGFSMDDEIDEVDNTGSHISFLTEAFDPADPTAPAIPVGTVRLVPKKGKLTRLAVTKGYRSYGLGRVLVTALEEFVASHPERVPEMIKTGADGKRYGPVRIHAQLYVIPFYAKFGYESIGEQFMEDGAPHQAMVRDVLIKA